MPWSYEEALEWLYARQALGIKLGLGKVERLLASVGDPQRAYRVVHVAGTNGKGSVARMMAGALQHSGFRTGVTTSPHLVAFTERVEIDGRPIERAAVASGLALLRPIVEGLDRSGDSATFFEVVTALAFVAFRDAGVAWAVVETGMGGRLDATNVVEPDLTIITNVDFDHTAHLGTTLPEIAFEKAGIMKRGVPCVTGATGQALSVIAARSHELQAPVSIVATSGATMVDHRRPDYTVVPGRVGLALLRPTGESFYDVGLPGAHQCDNAALVVASVEALRQQGVAIPERALCDALRETRHSGRLETFLVQADDLAPGAAPCVVEILVDGAHNPAAARALRAHLFATGWSGYHVVAGFCADKDWATALDEWLLPAAHLWAVPVRSPRALDPLRLVEAGRAAGVRSAAALDVAEAIRMACAAGAERIVVAGSLFLAGEAVAYLTGQSLEEIHGTQ